jgi:hypothetical protein
MNKKYRCELCKREITEITKHHLIPVEKGGKDSHTAILCKTCHCQIHALYTNSELSYRLYTIERLKKEEKIKRYLKFVKEHPGDLYIPIKKSKSARRRG